MFYQIDANYPEPQLIHDRLEGAAVITWMDLEKMIAPVYPTAQRAANAPPRKYYSLRLHNTDELREVDKENHKALVANTATPVLYRHASQLYLDAACETRFTQDTFSSSGLTRMLSIASLLGLNPESKAVILKKGVVVANPTLHAFLKGLTAAVKADSRFEELLHTTAYLDKKEADPVASACLSQTPHTFRKYHEFLVQHGVTDSPFLVIAEYLEKNGILIAKIKEEIWAYRSMLEAAEALTTTPFSEMCKALNRAFPDLITRANSPSGNPYFPDPNDIADYLSLASIRLQTKI
jgi:hypothetical protein